MATAENAKLEYEAGQTSFPMAALTDSGDHTTFTSAAAPWSKRSGFAPVICPNGIKTGGAVVPAVSAANDKVDVSALTCFLAGVDTSVAASVNTLAITRPATAVSKVCSITVTSAGAFAVVAGTDGSTTAFSETRAAAGGPPLIPTGSIEVAQVRVVSNTAAPITAAQIFQVPGTHRELSNYPVYERDDFEGTITFASELPLIHTGPVAKAVYASYAEPVFAAVSLASDFVPPETSHSVSSTQIYGTTLGSTSRTLNQGSFKAYLEDGVTDPLVQLKNEDLWFRFYPDRYKTPNLMQVGKLGIKRTFPAGADLVADCTISAAEEAVEVAS